MVRILSSFIPLVVLLAPSSSANPLTFQARADEQVAALNASASATGSGSGTTSSSDAFPTDVGYAGTIREGASPFLVVQNRLNATPTRGNAPLETRWVPLDSKDKSFNIFEHVGNESPYFSSPLFPETQKYQVLPGNCTVQQVHMLHRHGARYPTSSTTEGAPLFGATIANVSKNANFSASGPLTFLNDWKYELGAEILVPQGRKELFDSGVRAFYQYGKLYNSSTQAHKPVIRTTSEQRMLDSARFFNLGFFGFDAASEVNLEVIIETAGSNNTLASYDTCENSNNITVGDTYLRPVWDAIYLKNATSRLQKYVQGLTLDTKLVYGMQSLCAYETVALGYSNFCPLFTESEWEGYEYDLDLQFQGDYGFQSPTGRAQGIGWVQEFLHRLTNSTYDPNSSQGVTTENTTLDTSPTYFPLDQPFYFDFTHDDIIVSVLTALNFTQFEDHLDPKMPDPERNFVLSHITPFGAHLFFEVIECPPSHPSHNTSISSSTPTQYIRAILNEAIIPLSSAQGCALPRADGLCPLSEFVNHASQKASEAANFDYACFGNLTEVHVGDGVRNGTVYGSFK